MMKSAPRWPLACAYAAVANASATVLAVIWGHVIGVISGQDALSTPSRRISVAPEAAGRGFPVTDARS